MLNYQEYEEKVYHWLLSKHKVDNNFTFSLRKKASKGTEQDYFIGTEKSNYFGVTFWTLPIFYAGSSSDCINLIFKLKENAYSYKFEFTQTNTPKGQQNISALNLLKVVKQKLKNSFTLSRESGEDHKMFSFQIKKLTRTYASLDIMLVDIEKELDIIITTVNNCIEEEKKQNSDFDAHRITLNEFNEMHDKLFKRKEKYASTLENNSSNKKQIDDNINSTKNNLATNQILYGPPGTGKTYTTKRLAVELIDKITLKETEENRTFVVNRYKELEENGQAVFTTFHQSMSYEDFVEGIKPKTEDKKVTYEIEDGIFKNIASEAIKNSGTFEEVTFEERLQKLTDEWEETEDSELKIEMAKSEFTITNINKTNIYFNKKSGSNKHNLVISTLKDLFYEKRVMKSGLASYYYPIVEKLKAYPFSHKESISKNYVLIIDEINRGNVSAIFGELITLLEPDKRLGQKEAITIKLPYSKSDFGVPSNLHIIGTMNTADRSVEALDTALRRRFEFKEVMPKPELLENIVFGETTNTFNLEEVLTLINNRIELLLDRDYTIGHSYFINIKSGDTKALANAFTNKVVPLLQEYFYGDYGKIGLVLGKGFVEEKTNSNINFANFGYEGSNEFKTVTYAIKTVTETVIVQVINTLLNKEKENNTDAESE